MLMLRTAISTAVSGASVGEKQDSIYLSLSLIIRVPLLYTPTRPLLRDLRLPPQFNSRVIIDESCNFYQYDKSIRLKVCHRLDIVRGAKSLLIQININGK